MQLTLQQLTTHLRSKVAPLYLVSGDVPLLMAEACDAITNMVKAKYKPQHERMTVDGSFDTARFVLLTQTRGLFSEKIFVSINLQKIKMDKTATKVIESYLTNPSADVVVLIKTAKLTIPQKKTKWYQAIKLSSNAVNTDIWPVSEADLPGWIKNRLARAKLSADPEAISLLAGFTIGNLLATNQAIEKLKLLFSGQQVGCQQMLAAIHDSARFNVFDLADATLQGNAARSLRIINGLMAEGVEAILVLWCLSREVRALLQKAEQLQGGAPMAKIVAKEWPKRKPLVQAALRRLTVSRLQKLLLMAAKIDQIIKGAEIGNSWEQLKILALRMSRA